MCIRHIDDEGVFFTVYIMTGAEWNHRLQHSRYSF